MAVSGTVFVEASTSEREEASELPDRLQDIFDSRIAVHAAGHLSDVSVTLAAVVVVPEEMHEAEQLARHGLREREAELETAGARLLPLVWDAENFDFATVPAAPEPLRRWNACALDDLTGIVSALRVSLGLDVAEHDRKGFISYRRSDDKEIAQQAYDALRHEGFSVFKDDKSLPAGSPIQKEIRERLNQMDFVLLVEAADAATSPGRAHDGDRNARPDPDSVRWSQCSHALGARRPSNDVGLPDYPWPVGPSCMRESAGAGLSTSVSSTRSSVWRNSPNWRSNRCPRQGPASSSVVTN